MDTTTRSRHRKAAAPVQQGTSVLTRWTTRLHVPPDRTALATPPCARCVLPDTSVQARVVVQHCARKDLTLSPTGLTASFALPGITVSIQTRYDLALGLSLVLLLFSYVWYLRENG